MEEKQFLNLLIVPYGIEMSLDSDTLSPFAELLIVPYGIEMCEDHDSCLDSWSFNRTLWNWNTPTVAASTMAASF